MEHAGPQNPYESYCYHCRVTAPSDARVCLHCGNRLTHQRPDPKSLIPQALSGEASDEEELDGPRRFGAASPMTVVWILLFLVGSLYRLCS